MDVFSADNGMYRCRKYVQKAFRRSQIPEGQVINRFQNNGVDYTSASSSKYTIITNEERGRERARERENDILDIDATWTVAR